MSNLSGEAMAAGVRPASTLEELMVDVDCILAMIKREIANRRDLDALAVDANVIIPEELTVHITCGNSTFIAPASVLNVDDFRPLVEPIRRLGEERTVRLLGDLLDAVEPLRDFCNPPEKEETDGGQPGSAREPTAEGPLAAFQRRNNARGPGAEPGN